MKSSEVSLQLVVDNEVLLRKAAGLLVNEVFGGKWPMIEDELEAVAGRQVVVVVQDDLPLAASSFTVGCGAAANKFTYLSLLATDPKERGHGYAQMLMQYVVEAGRAAGDGYVQAIPCQGSMEYYRHVGFDEFYPE